MARSRPRLRDLRRNISDYDGPSSEKYTKAAANTLRKVVRLSDCCGRPGQPGC